MEVFNAIERFKNKSRDIDLQFGISTVPLTTNDTVPEPRYIEQPIGPLFALYKRTPAGYNRILFSGLTKDEANQKCEYLNLVEAKKRQRKERELNGNGLEYAPDAHEVVFFDVVEMGTGQENAYWNPKQILK